MYTLNSCRDFCSDIIPLFESASAPGDYRKLMLKTHQAFLQCFQPKKPEWETTTLANAIHAYYAGDVPGGAPEENADGKDIESFYWKRFLEKMPAGDLNSIPHLQSMYLKLFHTIITVHDIMKMTGAGEGYPHPLSRDMDVRSMHSGDIPQKGNGRIIGEAMTTALRIEAATARECRLRTERQLRLFFGFPTSATHIVFEKDDPTKYPLGLIGGTLINIDPHATKAPPAIQIANQTLKGYWALLTHGRQFSIKTIGVRGDFGFPQSAKLLAHILTEFRECAITQDFFK